jgi:hypothetical protein
MKKLFAFSLAVLFFFNTWGYFWIFCYNRQVVRSEMHDLLKSGLFHNTFSIIRIVNPSSNPDFKWTERDEFNYKGNLFDIISEKQEGTVTVFICINDRKEEIVLAAFRQSFDQSAGQTNPAKAKHAQAMLYHIITLALVNEITNPTPQNASDITFYIPDYSLASKYHLTAVPPPEV